MTKSSAYEAGDIRRSVDREGMSRPELTGMLVAYAQEVGITYDEVDDELYETIEETGYASGEPEQWAEWLNDTTLEQVAWDMYEHDHPIATGWPDSEQDSRTEQQAAGGSAYAPVLWQKQDDEFQNWVEGVESLLSEQTPEQGEMRPEYGEGVSYHTATDGEHDLHFSFPNQKLEDIERAVYDGNPTDELPGHHQ